MNSKGARFTHFFLFLFALTLIFSCTKIITTDIGSGLIPPVDGVTTKDTVLDVFSKNTNFDTAYVGISDNHVLGYISNLSDPVFGATKASINFQVAPPNSAFEFPAEPDKIILDSVVLCLSYRGVWGDSLKRLNLHVYKIDPEEPFTSDSVYRSTKVFEKAQDISEFSFGTDVDITRLDDADTTEFYGESTANQIRLRLNNTFGRQLIDLDTSFYKTDSTFYNYLRGIIVEPSETTGLDQSLLLVNLLDTSTHLSLYYRTLDTAGKYDTVTTKFSPNQITSANCNSIIRNYQGTQIPSYFASADTNSDLIFMQATPGTYATLKIPGITTMPNVIIHRAEILMYQVPDLNSASDTYFTPPNLFLSALSQDSGRRFAIPYDIVFSGTSIGNLVQFGISPKAQVDKNTGRTTSFYSFDITRYAQSIVTKQNKLYDLILSAPYNQYIYPIEATTFAYPISSPSLNTAGVGRVRLGGGSNSQYKMRLHIVYSLAQ